MKYPLFHPDESKFLELTFEIHDEVNLTLVSPVVQKLLLSHILSRDFTITF
ncbi:hypothetical protein [Bacillus sp. 196mf]|uniref:hypothetical protein n=1 Tax=Bacillus sp. 196mf TaxID=1761754 RepID=UPI0015E88EE1|nr:hypothetical protein [Bacillus sp. 196mf]